MTHLHLRRGNQHHAVDIQRDGVTHRVTIEGTEKVVEAHYLDDATLLLTVDGRRYQVGIARSGRERFVGVGGEVYHFVSESGAVSTHSVGNIAPPEITAPMPGKVLQILVQPGDHVDTGAGLLILEAMKMENRLTAEAAATVAEVRVTAGQTVDGGQVLVVLEYEGEA